MSLRIVTTGGTGLIGAALTSRLVARGDDVTNLSRSGPGPTWDPTGGILDPAVLAGADVVVNLAGAPISQRWTVEQRHLIRESRVNGTTLLVRAMEALPPRARPMHLLSGSAVGWYGDRGDELLDESSPPGTGFLPDVARDWEEAAGAAAALGVRVGLLRTGIVLSAKGGALAELARLFRVGLGGRTGSGRQWVPWIHIDDVVALIVWFVDNAVEGPVLATSPQPERQAAFAATLARVLHRPAWAAAPAAVLRLALGRGFADEIVLASQRTRPARAVAGGFTFRFPVLEPALRDLLG